MEIQSIVISAAITIFALALLIISLLSYWKYKNKKLLLISLVFLFFLIRGALLSLSIFYPDLEAITSSMYIWIVDLVILILLYIASLKR